MFSLSSSVPALMPSSYFGKRCPGFDAHSNLGSRLGCKRVPALRLPARLPVFPRHLIVGMHLHAQLFFGENRFDQQRRVCPALISRWRTVAKQGITFLAKQRAQLFPACGPGRNQAIVARQPDFAYRIALGYAVIPWPQIAKSPDPRRKHGLDAKRRDLCRYNAHAKSSGPSLSSSL